MTLLAAMPELGRVDRRAGASLGGLDPRRRERGKWRGQRYPGQGRGYVRRALYLAALSAMRSGSPLAPFVLRLRERGKAGKSIAIVVARKL